MVLIHNWLDFLTQAKQLYIDSPAQTRYSIKYRHADAEMTLKVTDDHKCLLFRSHLQSDLRYVDKINSAFFKLMTAKQPEQVQLTEELSEERKVDKKSSASGSGLASPTKPGSNKGRKRSTKRNA